MTSKFVINNEQGLHSGVEVYFENAVRKEISLSFDCFTRMHPVYANVFQLEGISSMVCTRGSTVRVPKTAVQFTSGSNEENGVGI